MEKKLTKSAYVILGLLSKHEHSGYELKKIMGKIARFYWSESNAQIYPILKKLDQADCVTSELDKSSGARKRQVYSLTEKGHSELMQWLLTPCEPSMYREELLLKMSVGQNLTDAQLCEQLKHYQAQLDEQLEHYEIIQTHILEDHAGKADQPYLFITYGHVKLVLNAKMKWCKQTLKMLETKGIK